MSDSVRCMWMRGGTSKGGYFLANDLPERRDEFLLRMMGSPDVRQIDGMGGADPLASKVAIVKKSDRPGVDVDYLFLQVAVDQPVVSDAQNCGNLLAGVGPFAIERDLIEVSGDIASVTIFMENTGQTAIAKVPIDNGRPVYTGSTSIDGVPGSAAAIPLEFKDTAGSSCGALLPTGNEIDTINGTGVTMIDNGMPVVVLRASDMNIRGDESRDELEADAALKSRLEAIRLACGLLMNLGDVEDKTVPKMTMVSTPGPDGTISTRTFIPHRCHSSIGVLGAVSVATACLLPESPAYKLASLPEGKHKMLAIEHPSGSTAIEAVLDDDGVMQSAAIVRTARKLFDGVVFS